LKILGKSALTPDLTDDKFSVQTACRFSLQLISQIFSATKGWRAVFAI
jgi:hypothetical protein